MKRYDKEIILTKKEAIEWHRKMWNQIADKLEKGVLYKSLEIYKEEFLKENGFDNISANCFCCEFSGDNCNLCPVEWTDGRCYYISSEEHLFAIEPNLKRKAELAREIANLPEKVESVVARVDWKERIMEKFNRKY